MDDSRWPSMTPARSRTTGSVSPTYPMIARRLRYDSAGFSPQAVLFLDNIVVHPPSWSTLRRPAAFAHTQDGNRAMLSVPIGMLSALGEPGPKLFSFGHPCAQRYGGDTVFAA